MGPIDGIIQWEKPSYLGAQVGNDGQGFTFADNASNKVLVVDADSDEVVTYSLWQSAYDLSTAVSASAEVLDISNLY